MQSSKILSSTDPIHPLANSYMISDEITVKVRKRAIPENIHTPPMDDVGNPVINAQ